MAKKKTVVELDDVTKQEIIAARELLDVSEYADKRMIKNAIYERFHWNKDPKRPYKQQIEAAITLLLKHYQPDSSDEAKAARAQEKADEVTRREFEGNFWQLERVSKVVPNPEAAQIRAGLRATYDTLNKRDKLAFIKTAGHVFQMTDEEKAALEKMNNENQEKWQAERAKEKAISDARQAVWQEKDPEKKKELRKVLLDLTKEEREQKAKQKKAEQERIANVEQTKTEYSGAWSEAVKVSAQAVTAQSMGIYFYGLTLRNGQGNCSLGLWGELEGYRKIQKTIIMFAGALSEVKLDIVEEIPSYRGGYLSDICAVHRLDEREVVRELLGYAKSLIDANWSTILAIGTHLLATGEVTGRKFRTIHVETTGSEDWPKPTFIFSQGLLAAMVPLPVVAMPPTTDGSGLVN